jgi:hypothetical protein
LPLPAKEEEKGKVVKREQSMTNRLHSKDGSYQRWRYGQQLH